LLEGNNVNLRKAENEDVSLVEEWWCNPQYMGNFQDIMTISKAKMEKVMLSTIDTPRF